MSDLYSASIVSRDCESATRRVVPFHLRLSFRAINRFAPDVTNGWTGAVLVIAVLVALCFPANAAETPPATPSATQIWLVDTRSAPGCGDLEAGLARINYWRLAESGGRCQWQAADAAGFQASADPALPTVVLIHGYGTDRDWAVHHGDEMRGLLQQVGCRALVSADCLVVAGGSRFARAAGNPK